MKKMKVRKAPHRNKGQCLRSHTRGHSVDGCGPWPGAWVTQCEATPTAGARLPTHPQIWQFLMQREVTELRPRTTVWQRNSHHPTALSIFLFVPQRKSWIVKFLHLKFLYLEVGEMLPSLRCRPSKYGNGTLGIAEASMQVGATGRRSHHFLFSGSAQKGQYGEEDRPEIN
jgi:hypothetical protein